MRQKLKYQIDFVRGDFFSDPPICLINLYYLSESSDCMVKTKEANVCKEDDRYRTASGACNNLRNTALGEAGVAMGRLAPPAYDDGG